MTHAQATHPGGRKWIAHYLNMTAHQQQQIEREVHALERERDAMSDGT